MPNPYGVPEISVHELAQRRDDKVDFVLLDVREPHELAYANLGDSVLLVPLSLLAERRLDALPEEVTADSTKEIVVMCHHGSRSAQVVTFLMQNGWTNVLNLDGGIEAYALEIDPSIGRY